MALLGTHKQAMSSLGCLLFFVSFFSYSSLTEECVCMEVGGKGPTGKYSFTPISSQFRDLTGKSSHHLYSQTTVKKFPGNASVLVWVPALSWMHHCGQAWVACPVPRVLRMTPSLNSRDGAGRELSLDGRGGVGTTGGRRKSLMN